MKNFKPYIEVCAKSSSCSYQDVLPKEILAKLLKNEIDIPKEYENHIIYFMNEMPIDLICGCLYELNLNIKNLLFLNNKLPKGFQTIRIKEIDEYFRNYKNTVR